MTIYKSFSSAATKRLGAQLARKIAKRGPRARATVLALQGELGAGKTTFVQGFVRGLGVKKRAVSPTFILIRSFKLQVLSFTKLYHIDAYRIKNPREFYHLGLEGILGDPHNIVLIEWADRIKKFLPKKTIWLEFRHGKKEHERTVRIQNLRT